MATSEFHDAHESLLPTRHSRESIDAGRPLLVHENGSGEPSTSGAPRHEGATLFQATFNVVNIFMGIGLLSMPYAMRMSGWVGLVALVGATAVFCLSGKLIVRSFDRLPEGVPQTYPALGVLALGPAGHALVGAFALAEVFGAACLLLIVMWKEAALLVAPPDVGGWDAFHVSAGACLAATAPLLLIPNFKRLSWLSFLGFASTVLVTLTVVLAISLDPDRTRMPVQPPAPHSLAHWGIFQSIGIFAVSVSGHSSLPVLRNSMKRPQDFNAVLNLSFGAMAIVYALVAGGGYYYFGDAAAELITTDLAGDSVFTGRWLGLPGLTVDKAVAACILVNAYTTYPCLVLVIQDMIWCVSPYSRRGGAYRHPSWSVVIALRLAIFAVGAVIALLAYRVLGNVMSLVGGVCSISCSLLLPALFYLRLFWKELGPARRAGGALLLFGGAALLSLILAQNALDLARRLTPPAAPQGATGLAYRP